MYRPYGTHLTALSTRHSRAGLQVVPSLRDCFLLGLKRL
jgi:hypothetical protein